MPYSKDINFIFSFDVIISSCAIFKFVWLVGIDFMRFLFLICFSAIIAGRCVPTVIT